MIGYMERSSRVICTTVIGCVREAGMKAAGMLEAVLMSLL